ncbi:MAG TPA: sulfurtransferase TusA family protein [Thermoplasmata archaeon]|nr:sulfurtransferase TusA family protein [Thermoplasmata archaeon]
MDDDVAPRTQPERPASDPPATELWSPAVSFVAALAARDFSGLEACLDPKVRFRALVPVGLREREGAKETTTLIQSWFEGVERFEVLGSGVVPIAHRAHVWYRLREFYPDGERAIIEQNAYCELKRGRISTIDLVCSGHVAEPPAPSSRVHRFDAGELGCGSGLPQEFRRQIEAVPVGSILEVRTRDPSAKEDLPALARLLGHRVLSIQENPEGVTVVGVERAR